jgi:hypothetical protein
MARENDRFITSKIKKRGRTVNIFLMLALAVQLIAIFTTQADVPLHWGANGEADTFGSPWLTLITWFVLAIAAVLCKFTATHISVKYWNKPSKIQPSELEGWYAYNMKMIYNVSLMISIMALGIALIYLFPSI